jgi:hypothetical protein
MKNETEHQITSYDAPFPIAVGGSIGTDRVREFANADVLEIPEEIRGIEEFLPLGETAVHSFFSTAS